MYCTLYWRFLSTCISLHCIEASSVHVLNFTVFMPLENMFLTSLHWSFLSTFMSLNCIETSLKNYTLFHCIEASWVHVHHFNLLNLLQYMYFTLMYWSFFSACTSLHIIEPSWVHADQIPVLNLSEYRNRYMFLT